MMDLTFRLCMLGLTACLLPALCCIRIWVGFGRCLKIWRGGLLLTGLRFVRLSSLRGSRNLCARVLKSGLRM